MKIRKYKKSDERKVKELIFSVLISIYKKTKVKWENFNDYLVFYIAENKGKIVGTIALKRIYKNQGRLKRLYVDKKYRKKKIAQKLYNKIISYCKQNNIKIVYLTTYPQMCEAQKFYIKQGFKQTKKKYKDKRRQFVLEIK